MTDTGESSSSSSDVVAAVDANTAANTAAIATAADSDSNTVDDTDDAISREDLIELIRAVKFKNPDFSQRQVHTEIVTEIPARFPQYAGSLTPERLGLNDVKKAWKKAILQQQQQQSNGNNNNTNADLAERLRAMTTAPQVYTIGLEQHNESNGNAAAATGINSRSAAAAREYVAKFLEEARAETSARERELLEDYVHVFLDVPADGAVAKKPHQALINFQQQGPVPAVTATATTKPVAKRGGSNKKKGGKKKAAAPAPVPPQRTAAADANHNAPFADAIVVKIQMAAPIDANDTAQHPMLLYDKTRAYKTFVHPSSALTGAAATATTVESAGESGKSSHDDDDGYSRLAHWIRTKGVGGALGSAGGTKAYFYGRLTTANKHTKILSIYVKALAPAEGQEF